MLRLILVLVLSLAACTEPAAVVSPEPDGFVPPEPDAGQDAASALDAGSDAAMAPDAGQDAAPEPDAGQDAGGPRFGFTTSAYASPSGVWTDCLGQGGTVAYAADLPFPILAGYDSPPGETSAAGYWLWVRDPNAPIDNPTKLKTISINAGSGVPTRASFGVCQF